MNTQPQPEPDEVVEAETVEAQRELVVRQTAPAATVTPQVQADELVARLDVMRDAIAKAMTKDVDYGNIPGVDKPALLKPGAEKLGVLFQLDIQLRNEKTWGPDEHLTVMSHATVYHAPTGSRLGYGEGLCTTRERKYGKRQKQRECPNCGAAAVIKGKAEYGSGWACWNKRGGCGARFSDGDERIEGQAVGEIENPDLPDTWNTVIKMAEKRARVDAVLAVTGASALFSEDSDEAPGEEVPPLLEASVELKQTARNALHYLLDADPRATGNTLDALMRYFDGRLPAAAAQAVVLAAKAVKDRRDDPGAPIDLPDGDS